MNTLTTYFYNGANAGWTGFGVVTFNAINYWTLYAEVAIFYDGFIRSNVLPATQPMNLPPLQNVGFNAQFYKCTAAGVPTSKFSGATLVSAVPIFDVANRANCLGVKYTFESPIMNEDCVDNFCLVWSTNPIEMPYGGDMIFIGAQNGVTPPFQPC